MPPAPKLFPGKEGTDYKLVRYGDKVYVVYRVNLGGDKWVNTTWRIDPEDYKAFDIDPSSIDQIGRSQFQNLNVFGAFSEVLVRNLRQDEHPFQGYMKELKERYGNVPWLDNREFMSVMLMGYAENWSATELEQRLKQTGWYQNRTDRSRQWALEFTEAEREQELELWQTRVLDALDNQIFGPEVSFRKHGWTSEQIHNVAENIASGKWGDPTEGFETWLASATNRAENIKGTTAWITAQQAGEAARAQMNRPEDVKQKLREEAFQWLGPRGVPDNEVLKRWSEGLVSEKYSDADWQQFLRKHAQALYPWLGPEEMWQDRASVYKRIIEENWGQPIGWDNALLYKMGEKDAKGNYTGKPMDYDNFEQLVRSRPEFWGGPVAKQEGFELFNVLNETFNGVQT